MDDFFLEPNKDRFDREVNRLIADGDDRGLLDRFEAMPDRVRQMRADDEERFDVADTVTNAGGAAAIALRRNKAGLVTAAITGLVATYRLGDMERDGADDADVHLFEGAAAALWSLGAVAVHTRRFALVRELVTLQPKEGGYYSTWLRHAQVMSARRATDPHDDNILNVAAHVLRSHPSYGMTAASDEDRLAALSVFDFLAYLVLAGDSDVRTNFYPSYAKHPADVIEPVVIELRTNDELRSTVFDGTHEDLRRVLREANEMALFQAAQHRTAQRDWRYAGFQDARTWMYIREGGLWESWQV